MSAQPGTTASDVLDRLVQTLRWHGVTVVAIVVAAAIGAVAFTSGLPDRFESEAIVALTPADDRGSDPSLIRLRAPTYVSYLLADATQEAIAAALGGDPEGELGDLQADLLSDTGTIVIQAESAEPERAVEIALATVAAAQEFAQGELHLRLDVVAAPVLPSSPSGPPRRLIVAAALVAASLLALGGALLWDQLRPRLRTAETLARLSGAPALAEVPRRRRVSLRSEDTDPRVTTAVRVLRTHLDGELKLPATLAVLSSVRGEGRTTITAQLAQSLADLDFRVLMVDADVDSRSLGRAFGHDHNERLARVLTGKDVLTSVVRETEMAGVWVVPADTTTTADAMSRGIARLLAAAREQFDVVLVDTPPLLGGDLARTVALAAEQVLVVAAVGTSLTDVEQTSAALANLRVRPVGSVVNRGRARGLT